VKNLHSFDLTMEYRTMNNSTIKQKTVASEPQPFRFKFAFWRQPRESNSNIYQIIKDRRNALFIIEMNEYPLINENKHRINDSPTQKLSRLRGNLQKWVKYWNRGRIREDNPKVSIVEFESRCRISSRTLCVNARPILDTERTQQTGLSNHWIVGH
jgi:hypothetical protein